MIFRCTVWVDMTLDRPASARSEPRKLAMVKGSRAAAKAAAFEIVAFWPKRSAPPR